MIFTRRTLEAISSIALIWLFLAVPEIVLGAGDYDVVLGVSRTEGVAPLAVFFDATGTPELADGSYVDATVAWQFDADNVDPDAAYRTASGFVAAHVFENPGTYRVRADIYDARGRQAYAEITITVRPFSGQTFYVAQDGLDSNTGTTMDAPVRTVRHALLDLAGPDTRILFRKGDTFETTFVNAGGKAGPVLIAGYEDPDSPSSQAPIIFNTAADSDWATIYLGDDWRIMDLRVRSGGCTAGESGPRYPGGVGFSGSCRNSLIYRMELDHLSNGWMGPYGQYNTVAQCNIHDVSGTGYSSAGDGGALIGNWVHDKCTDDPEHVYRLQGGTRYFIAFNNFEGNVVNYDSLTIRGNSEKVVIYKNTLDRTTGIWPQVRNAYEEYQHHCVLDANLFIGRVDPPGYTTASPIRQLAIGLHAKDIVVRNNIIYNYEFGINISDDSVVGPSQRIKVYNNTFINATAGSGFYAVSVDPACFDIEVANNLVLDAAGSAIPYSRVIYGGGACAVFSGTSDHNLLYGGSWSESMVLFNACNLADWRLATTNDLNSRFQDPALAGLEVESANFVMPLANSPARNSGQFTAAALDYHGNPRDWSRDIGAVEYIDTVTDVESPTAPVDLGATVISDGRIDLSWSPSTDNIGVAGYRIYRNGDQIAATADTFYEDDACTPSTPYTYTVRAFDAVANVSAPSNAVSVETPGTLPAPGQSGNTTDTGDGGGSGGCFISALEF